MKSKWFVTVSLLIVASIALSACGGAGGGDETAAGPLQEVGEGEGALSIVAWAGYIESGETDPALRLGDRIRSQTLVAKSM